MIRSLAAAALLLSGAAALATPPKTDEKEKSSDKGDKMICKRFLETGSLVRGYRTCKTKREWEAERDNLRVTQSLNSCANQGTTGTC